VSACSSLEPRNMVRMSRYWGCIRYLHDTTVPWQRTTQPKASDHPCNIISVPHRSHRWSVMLLGPLLVLSQKEMAQPRSHWPFEKPSWIGRGGEPSQPLADLCLALRHLRAAALQHDAPKASLRQVILRYLVPYCCRPFREPVREPKVCVAALSPSC